MIIKVLDNKKKKVLQVKIELTENMYIVAPEVFDEKFNYLKYRLLNIRKQYMNLYLENKNNYASYEKDMYNEMKNMLIKEMERIHRTEGIMYYTI